MGEAQSRQGSKQDSTEMSNGFFDRLKDGGYKRIVYGFDLYAALAVVIFAFTANYLSTFDIVRIELVNNGTPFAISLTAFILAGVSILVSFSDEKFLGLLKELEIYNTLIFNFEFGIYLAIITSGIGITLQTYSSILISIGYFNLFFYTYLFFFTYMILAAANIVSTVVSIGSRKAKLASLR